MTVLLRVPPPADLARAALTYPEVGATAGALPPGYRHVARSVRVGQGQSCFDRCADALLGWEVHRRAGLGVFADRPTAGPGGVVAVVIGVGRWGVVAPCRVVHLVDEPDRRGFAYGTLPGHPERGEESFVVSRETDGTVTFTVTAFSRPGNLLARLGGPLARRIQDLYIGRYLRAAAALAQP
ncbi:Uncharacterized protein, UPF0548 family [Actinopolymorpha cephalotaxi]|uniref:Uncharacterized protein (UPF0548 family) n=1 Tax=Actinopolymorpha cephalotaxi TaxID=504797 RepID=A0A1I2N726_9ACTN|nr:DUF1990 domain-containing protein [Actinopolymorpha cephalotaxi]NYH85652.1 uncharacterized protein (UPF0548 family) [Actinopolymorpha cephalotaxi]SFF99562.1 Uncharacterized protein, UPF0548 family [Actinopolymorpha cephalotaxi]